MRMGDITDMLQLMEKIAVGPMRTTEDNTNVPLKALGEAIKAQRSRLSMSQTRLGKLSGIHQTRISEYESGLAQPGLDTLAALERALECPGQLWAAYIGLDSPDRPTLANLFADVELSSEEQLKVLEYAALLIRARITEMKKPTPLEQRIADARRVQQEREAKIKKDKAEKKEKETGVKTSQ